MPVTLKELAARANVHPSTVSRVANNDPGLRIAATTRTRIEALLRETEYRPNGVARRVDGVMLASTFLKDPAVRWLRHQRTPYVLVNRFSEDGVDPFVGSDDVMGATLATQHLIGLGHVRIGHLA